MATINDIYIFVEDENVNRDTEITQHPVEEGLPTTSTIRAKPKTISLKGAIVGYGSLSADDVIERIENLRTTGSLVKYKGRNTVGNYKIRNFDTSHPNTNTGGADFNMELVEVRITKSAYTPPQGGSGGSGGSGNAGGGETNTPELKIGATVVFKGGSVYYSSDARRPSATRRRSTCEIYNINLKSWSLHQYCLISTDGGRVYGWVDVENIEGTGTNGTKSVTNGGTQQVRTK